MKINFLVILLSLGLSFNLNAQRDKCNCKSDLVFLNKKIEKLPSYKKNKVAYQKAFAVADIQAKNKMPYFDCFEVINELLLPLNDWHMGVIQKSSDSLGIAAIKYPSYTASLDDLYFYLKEKLVDEVEGIYHVNEDLSFGLVFNEKSKVYNAVVFGSPSGNWKEGDIVYRYIPLSKNSFKVVGAQYPTERLISYHEKISKGVILRAGFRKDTTANYFFKSPFPNDLFLFKELSSTVDYLKIGSFNSNYPILSEAEKFYKSLEDKLMKPHLILDLRDNGGGGDRNSDILFKALKKYVKNNNIHIITNASTGSNAEQFTLKLKRYKNTTSYGDLTRGALAYEIKPNDYYTLPSSGFMVILPSKAHGKYLKYETKGVAPDYFLDYTKNWISTVQNKIERSDGGY